MFTSVKGQSSGSSLVEGDIQMLLHYLMHHLIYHLCLRVSSTSFIINLIIIWFCCRVLFTSSEQQNCGS